MRKSFVALLLLVGAAAALASTAIAREDLGQDLGTKLVNAQILREMRSAVSLPGVSGPDTTYVGFKPGKVTTTNYWGIGKGNFRVYSTSPADYGYWGWDRDAVNDNITEVHGDSLFGWWPIRVLMNGGGGLDLTDDNRPWWALDIGNQANYVINQGTAHKRTFGVVGVWHRDNGSASGGGVNWAPLNGSTNSLWCGLRRDGDLSHIDPITGNAFNADVLSRNEIGGGSTGGGIGTNFKFPGYGNQWDQMAYRDIDVTGATDISVRFRFRTNMSTGRGTASASRTGWFDKDPLEVTFNGAAAGNFISSSAVAISDAPIDSFMVYIGAPAEGTFLASDGTTRTIYDGQRRWFSEVIRANEGLHREIFTDYGDNAEQQVTVGPVSLTGASAANKTRLVFRNKTNRGFDDEGGSVVGNYSSLGKGAAIIDDVEVDLGAGFVSLGDFETAAQVDNDLGVNPLDAWKTTGKPPGIYHHVHDVTDLIYEDLCGSVGGPFRICNLTGNVISMGDHDNSEAAGGLTPGTAEVELWEGMISPTVNLMNGGGTNEMDIDASIANATEDIYIEYDVYTGIFNGFATGNFWRGGYSAYPATQSDGVAKWSGLRLWPFIIFNPDPQCFQDQEPGYAFGLIQWNSSISESADYPDSLRMLLHKRQECYRFGITTGCSPTDGGYWDNVSMAFVDGAAPPMSINIWDWINDSFTVNGLNRNANALASSDFDTTSAIIQIGLNIAQTSGNTARYHVAGDSTAISALGDNVRIDMVFRVSPGPGNYMSLGNRSTGLRQAPANPTAVNYLAPNGNFWGEYLADNGVKGTTGGHTNDNTGLTNGGRDWNPLVWNSARCDTAEINFYTISARGIGIPAPGAFATIYEETDAKFTTLGIAKKRCFLNEATATVNQLNIVCDISLTDGWPTAAGYVAENGLPLGDTYEYTKIMPDGQFSPGTHVQYFIRREDTPIDLGPFFAPDTNVVFPQPSEGSTDAHRWQQFSVLPDAWKKGAYPQVLGGGLGQACMLYVDLNDRRGNERVWVSIADSIGATQSIKYGAHNGWHAASGVSLDDPSGFVYNLNQQPGTTWDMYGVKASESLNSKVAGLGVDFSNHTPSNQITNKWSFQGPSLGMLEEFYKVVLILTGDLNSGILGPFNNYGVNDIKMLQDFMLGGQSENEFHRGVWIQGDGFVESEDGRSLLSSYLHVSLRDPSYLLLTGNNDACVDLVTQSPITTNGDIYGILNPCTRTNDVLLNGTGSVPSTLYSPAGNAAPPVIAGVFHDIDNVSGEYWQSVVDGWDIENLRSRFCDQSNGRLAYYYNVLTNIFGKICQIAGAPPITTDVPNNPSGTEFVNFMNLRNNPLVTGTATVHFGLAKSDRVEVKVFDVSGRLVRTLADREFQPALQGHKLVWDGTDNNGRQVARGVYFTQVKYVNSRFTDAKKLTVLK